MSIPPEFIENTPDPLHARPPSARVGRRSPGDPAILPSLTLRLDDLFHRVRQRRTREASLRRRGVALILDVFRRGRS